MGRHEEEREKGVRENNVWGKQYKEKFSIRF